MCTDRSSRARSAVSANDRHDGEAVIRRVITIAAVLTTVACSQKIDQAKFDGLHRAGRTVRENTSVGVALLKFRKGVSQYATEVSLATDRASSPIEKEFVGLHATALKSYKDSLSVWNAKLANGGE